MNTARYCAVIVTYNGSKYLERCLKSLSRCIPKIDVVVVDNASNDDTVDIAKRFRNIFLLELKENHGFGGANNIGIEYACNNLDADFVVLLNQDAYIDSTAWPRFGELPTSIKSNLVAFMQFGPDGSSLDFNFQKYYTKEDNCPGFLEDLSRGPLKDYYQARFINAAAWIMPREMLKVVGGFNPVFFHYGEDNNFIHRAHYWGFKLFLVPSISVIHDRIESDHQSSSYFQVAESKKRELIQSMADPSSAISFLGFCSQTLVQFCKDLVKMRLGPKSASVISLQLIASGKLTQVIRLRKESLRNSSFLNIE